MIPRQNGMLRGFIVIGCCLAVAVSWSTFTTVQGDDHKGGQKDPVNWAPVEKMGLYLCAFHVGKKDAKFQVEAHHYCSPIGDIHQCAVFDSRGPNSKLLGTEYIINDELYQKLPSDEKKYWHPHAYEILSGQLVAPDMPKMGDDAFVGFITSWGKTFHTWADPSTPIPMGEPILMWSANGDGQISEGLISKRDAQFNINTSEIRKRRAFMGFEVPQVSPPKSLKDNARRWTNKGKDEPTKRPDAKP